MFTSCMFCSRPFGANEVLEAFPVGSRLAFDAEKGRLWVVCRRCERWNLTPIEERWEAVEACERLFAETRLRVSTQNIGLARHPGGLELVRIGRPLRPEFAAWRYGDQFGRRRKRAIAYGVAGGAAVAALLVGGAAAGIAVGPFAAQTGNLVRLFQYGARRLKLRTAYGELVLGPNELESARIRRLGNGWALTVSKGWRKNAVVHEFQGDEAERVTGLLLTRINYSGGSRQTVRKAVREIEAAGHPEAFLADAVRRIDAEGSSPTKGRLAKTPTPVRLALEMALHEERERRALEGELRGLELIWRREEEVAAISDDLLLPESARERLAAMRDVRTPPEGGTPGS